MGSVHFTVLKSYEHMGKVWLAVLSAPYDTSGSDRGKCLVPAPRWAGGAATTWEQGPGVQALASKEVDLLWTDHVSLLKARLSIPRASYVSGPRLSSHATATLHKPVCFGSQPGNVGLSALARCWLFALRSES